MIPTSGVSFPYQNFDEIQLAIGDSFMSMPDWATWFAWLGQWMKAQSSSTGRRVAVIRTPTRRTAAAFVALGALVASARTYDESLDWDALKSLPIGTKVYWRDKSLTLGDKSRSLSGTVQGLEPLGDQDLLVVALGSKVRGRPATYRFGKGGALGHGITLGAITTKADAQLLGLNRVMNALIPGFKTSWLHTPNPESILLTERDRFVTDLEGLKVTIQGHTTECLSTILAVTDPGGRIHGKTKIISPRNSGMLDADCDVVILDGPQAVLRLPNTTAKSIVALVDHAEYDEEIEQLITALMGYRCDENVEPPASGVLLPPPQIKAVVIGLGDGPGHDLQMN